MKRLPFLIPLAVALMALAACTSSSGSRWMPPEPASPEAVWQPPQASPALPAVPVPAVPPALPPPDKPISLDIVLNVALKNNPRTRAAWAQANSAWADLGSRKSAYYPTLDIGGAFARSKQSTGSFSTEVLSTYGPYAALNYVLYDFGQRKANAESAQAAFLASGFAHNAMLAEVALEVEEAYYAYLQSLALRDAASVNVKDTQESLKASQERRKAGVATIADVLQAATAASYAKLALQQAEGQIQSMKGGLATAMGLPADIQVTVAELPDVKDAPDVQGDLELLVKQALADRSDLLAARAGTLKAVKDFEKAGADRWPVFTLGASANKYYFYNMPGVNPLDTYSAAVGVQIPLFTGYDLTYKRLKAQADAESAAATSAALSNQIILQVWTSFYDLRTARQQLDTSKDLLASAEESEKVALERYKAGVGTILDLLSAQSSLSSARAQIVKSRADWYVSLARLAHDTGRLDFTEASMSDALSPKEK